MLRRPFYQGSRVDSANGVPRPRLAEPPKPIYKSGDHVDLTLLIGSHGEVITTRKLSVAVQRHSPYSGRIQYQLLDDERNRIDYTRWFDEESLSFHDESLPDPKCRRVSKNGRPCGFVPTRPSGLCIRHRAKLDWDRERQKKKLEAELAAREQLALSDKSSPLESSEHQVPQENTNLPDATDPQDENSEDSAPQVSLQMWGEADLFARTAARSNTSYFDAQHLVQPPSYSQISFATLDVQGRLHRLRLTRPCLILILCAAVTVTSSLVIALWWTMAHNDASAGFTMAAYVVAVGGLILYPIQTQHSKNCQCWTQIPQPTPLTL